MDGRWQRFCIVGVGGHARTKLIPAIAANGQELAGLVSGKRDHGPTEAPVFATIREALQALPGETAFVVASPPTAHFEQAMPIVAAGRDVIVEKPAFVALEEARLVGEAAARSGALLIEGFMNRYTDMHRRFLADWSEARPASVDCAFTIPGAPEGTFRSKPAIGASNLYDMGCYLLAALTDAGLRLDELALDRVDETGTPERERLHLSGALDGVAVRGLIGVDAAYANWLRLSRPDRSTVEYSPFFYGRAAERHIVEMRDDGRAETVIEDVNGFEAMFAIPRREWRDSQSERLARMTEVTRQLERLGRDLAAARAEAAARQSKPA